MHNSFNSFGSITVGCGTACIPLFGELRIFKLGSYIFGLRRCINQIVKSLKGFESLYFYILYSVTIIALLLMLVFRGRLTQVCVRDPKTVVKNPESLTNELWQSLAYDKSKYKHSFHLRWNTKQGFVIAFFFCRSRLSSSGWWNSTMW